MLFTILQPAAAELSRIVQFIEEKAVDMDALKDVIERYDLTEAWQKFCDVSGVENAFALGTNVP